MFDLERDFRIVLLLLGPSGIRGGNRRLERLWKRRGGEMYKPLFPSAWKSRKPGGISTFPRHGRDGASPAPRAGSEPDRER